jgi:hypothetical protein
VLNVVDDVTAGNAWHAVVDTSISGDVSSASSPTIAERRGCRA